MANTNLTQEQARALLEKLASDESFRELFQTAPARALHLLGLSAEAIIHLPAACLCVKELAPRDHYADLLRKCADAAIGSAMQMHPPQVGFK